MSKLRSVNTHFWSDTYIVDLDPIEKLLFLFLLTNEQTNMLGIYELHIRRIAFDTGVDKDMVLKIFERFEKAGKAKYSDGYVILQKFLKHQSFNANMETSAIKSWNDLPLNIRKDSFCEPILKGLKGFTKASEPIAEIEVEVEREIEREVEVEYELETEHEVTNVTALADDVPNASDSETWESAIRISDYLLEAICENDPTHKFVTNKPAKKRWVKEIDLGLRRDGRTEEQFMFLIDAVFRNCRDFSDLWDKWHINIQSGKKLRDKFDAIKNQIKSSKNGSSKKQTKGDLDVQFLRDV
jgi:hypothetical protein